MMVVSGETTRTSQTKTSDWRWTCDGPSGWVKPWRAVVLSGRERMFAQSESDVRYRVAFNTRSCDSVDPGDAAASDAETETDYFEVSGG